ncbi:MAG: TetR/AcrR family transcriptional regulator [Candidatus Latescibacter sp.]|nr:TetR/AcrR family transcriptional regulator [Candidatus Latescibacter sp.]
MELKTNSMEENLPRREREKAAHRKEIMEAAIRVFARRGVQAATLDEVAQEAEFSKGTIYLYFSSKEDLLFNILHNLSQNMITTFRETISGKRSFKEELHNLFVSIAEFSFNYKDHMKIVTGQHVAGFNALSREGCEKLSKMHNEMVKIILDRAREAYRNGELRDLPLEAITSMIHGSLDGMAISRWNFENLEEAKQAVSVFIDILFNGIGKGKEKKS